MKSNLLQENESFFDLEMEKIGLHIISPYVGKVRPKLANYLVRTYCKHGGKLWDPFCGSGTVPLEGWIKGIDVVATDLNKYAYITTLAKLFPPENIKKVVFEMNIIDMLVKETIELDEPIIVPDWVSAFFHPETLKEITLWCKYLIVRQNWFLLACLLGILHHQRPGFLSYPSSHGVPYLRDKKFPQNDFPSMYEYRNVYERLHRKVIRVLKTFPKLNYDLRREVFLQSSNVELVPNMKIDTIITSPPYMKALTYARDNRLRLWFLGVEKWKELDNIISPKKTDFVKLMASSFENWANHQTSGDKCVLIIGDIPYSKEETLCEVITDIASTNNYNLIELYDDPIPERKKVIKGNTGVKSEKICVFEKG
jgi:hypothetical protein